MTIEGVTSDCKERVWQLATEGITRRNATAANRFAIWERFVRISQKIMPRLSTVHGSQADYRSFAKFPLNRCLCAG